MAAARDVDAGIDELDDAADREELRGRFEMLLQELRVVLPGVQILLAFLLTVPFSARFVELDNAGRAAFGVSLAAATLSALALLTPTFLHRVGDRTARSARLRWSIRLMVVGLASLGVALVAALWAVVRFVYGPDAPWLVITPVVVVMAGLWIALPLLIRRRR